MSRLYRMGFVLSGVLVVLGGMTLAGGFTSSPDGKALKRNVVGVWDWEQPLAPGEEWVLMSAFMYNIGDDPLTLEKIEPVGSEGLGAVVEVTSIEVGPLPGLHGDSSGEKADDATPGGLFKTYPPTVAFAQEKMVCETQEIVPVEGFLLEPEEEARVLMRFRALADGVFDLSGVQVFYELDGRVFNQTLSIGMKGIVSAKRGQPLPIPPDEKSCATESQILPGGVAS